MPTHEPLKLEGLRKHVAEFRLEADLKIAPSERAILLGRSGSGKTTLLRLIAGLDCLDPRAGDTGRILLGKRDLSSLPPEQRGVGMIFQDQALFPSMSALENATFGLRVRGISKAEREKEAAPWFERLGLSNRQHSAVGLLSGGERQRVAFIRALIWKPSILLLDEPFSALDAELRGVLRRDLLALHKDWPVPMLFVTHDPADAEALATTRLEIRSSDSNRVRTVS